MITILLRLLTYSMIIIFFITKLLGSRNNLRLLSLMSPRSVAHLFSILISLLSSMIYILQDYPIIILICLMGIHSLYIMWIG
jgi:hypothetical protein